MNWAAILWLVLLVIFLIAEAATVTMVSLWFAAGALAALLVGLVHGPLWLQILAFVAVSAVMLLLLRPLHGVGIDFGIEPVCLLETLKGVCGVTSAPLGPLGIVA